MIKNHAVIILASGLSQRLGQSKQLLYKNGEPLIIQMLKLALSTQPQAIIVVIPENHTVIVAAIEKVTFQLPTVHIVNNPTPKTGMAHSLYLGIEALASLDSSLNISASNRVLIMGIDQVLLDSSHLTKLLAGEHSVIASSYPHLSDNFSIDKSKTNIVGLPINIDYALLKQWQAALIGDKGLRHFIRSLPPNQISTVVNQQLSYDIDTPEQFAYAQQQCWLDS